MACWAFGSPLSALRATSTSSPPSLLGGVRVLIGEAAAPLVAVWPNQINFQLPAGNRAEVLFSGLSAEYPGPWQITGKPSMTFDIMPYTS